MKTIQLAGAALALTLCTLPVFANEKLRIGLASIEGILTENNNSLIYNRLIDDLLASSDQADASKLYLTSAEALSLISRGKLDCAFPENLNTVENPEDFIHSDPINRVAAHIFSKTPAPYITLAELSNKNVAIPTAYDFDGLLAKYSDINFVRIDSAEQAWNLLDLNRVDAYLDYLPDMRFKFTSEQLQQLNYDIQSPIRQSSDRIICRKSKTNAALMKLFNQRIQRLKQSGQLQMMLGDFYIPTLAP